MPPARAIPLGFVAGLISALFLLLVGTGNPGAFILFSMALLPVMMAGLGAGMVAGAAAIVIGIGTTTWLGGAPYGLVFVGLIAVPSVLLVPLALAKPRPPSAHRMVWGVTGLGLAAFVFVYVLARGHYAGLVQGFETETLRALEEMQKQSDVQLPEPAAKLAAGIAFWELGGIIAVWMLIVVGNGLLAQGALARFERTLRPTPPMSSLELPYLLSVCFIFAIALWWFDIGGLAFIGANVAEILAVPLLLGGFAVIHAVMNATVQRPAARMAMLMAVYLIAFVSFWPIALIVMIGIVDQWLGLRRRVTGEPR